MEEAIRGQEKKGREGFVLPTFSHFPIKRLHFFLLQLLRWKVKWGPTPLLPPTPPSFPPRHLRRMIPISLPLDLLMIPCLCLRFTLSRLMRITTRKKTPVQNTITFKITRLGLRIKPKSSSRRLLNRRALCFAFLFIVVIDFGFGVLVSNNLEILYRFRKLLSFWAELINW